MFASIGLAAVVGYLLVSRGFPPDLPRLGPLHGFRRRSGAARSLERFCLIDDNCADEQVAHVDNLKGDRNIIVHGSWGEIDGIPVAASFRKETAGRTEVICEQYSPERMRKIAHDVSQCTKIVMMTITLIKSSGEK
jgi:hypothetical protein